MKRLRSEVSSVDHLDVAILCGLAADARISLADLARQVGLSAPTALGHALSVHMRIRPLPGQVGKLATLLNKLDAIVECDRMTGDDCFVVKAHVTSVKELERLIDRILSLGTTNTAIIQSSPVARRLPSMPLAE